MLCNRLNLKSQPGCFIETLRNRARDTVLNPWPPASGKPRAFYFTNGNTMTRTQKQLYIFIYKLRWWNLWNELSLVDHGASCCWDGTVNYDFESWTGWGHPFPPPQGTANIIFELFASHSGNHAHSRNFLRQTYSKLPWKRRATPDRLLTQRNLCWIRGKPRAVVFQAPSTSFWLVGSEAFPMWRAFEPPKRIDHDRSVYILHWLLNYLQSQQKDSWYLAEIQANN